MTTGGRTVEQRNNKKRSHTQLDSRKQVIAFQDRVMTINMKEAQHPLKRGKQVIDKSSIMLKISTKSMHRVLVSERPRRFLRKADGKNFIGPPFKFARTNDPIN